MAQRTTNHIPIPHLLVALAALSVVGCGHCDDPGQSASAQTMVSLVVGDGGVYPPVTGQVVVLQPMHGTPEWFGVAVRKLPPDTPPITYLPDGGIVGDEPGSISLSLDSGELDVTHGLGLSANASHPCSGPGDCAVLHFEIQLQRPSLEPTELEISGVLWDQDACEPSGVVEVLID